MDAPYWYERLTSQEDELPTEVVEDFWSTAAQLIRSGLRREEAERRAYEQVISPVFSLRESDASPLGAFVPG